MKPSPAAAVPGTAALTLNFFMQGVGMLFPWNALISAPEFFAARLHRPIDAPLAAAFMAANLGVSALAVGVPLAPRVDRALAMTSYIGNAAVFAVLVAAAAGTVPIDVGAVLAMAALSGGAAALIQTHLFGLAARLPPKCTSMMLIGQAVSGVAITLLHWLLALFLADPAHLAVIYFASALAVLGTCAALYVPLVGAVARAQLESASSSADALLATSRPGSRLTSPVPTPPGTPIPYAVTITEESPLNNNTLPPPLTERYLARGQLACALWPYILAMVLNFAVTLSLFPALTAQVPGTSLVALLFVVFNVGDTLGRTAPYLLRMSAPALVAAAMARLLFLPAFALLPLGPPKRVPTLLPAGAAVALVALMALSSGALAALALTAAPDARVHGRAMHDRERALVGRIMSFAMLLGLTLGAVASFGVLAVVVAP